MLLFWEGGWETDIQGGDAPVPFSLSHVLLDTDSERNTALKVTLFAVIVARKIGLDMIFNILK